MLVDPYSIEAIAAAMHIVENNGLRNELQCKAIQWAKPFTWKRTAEHLLRMYSSMLRMGKR